MKCFSKSENNEVDNVDCMIDVYGNLSLNDSLKKCQNFTQKFELVKELNSSPNSCVYLVSMQTANSQADNGVLFNSNKQAAVKVVSGTTFNYLLDKEYRILKGLDHPNILKPLEFKQGELCDNRNISYMCVPYYKNGELNELVKSRNGLGELDSLAYFFQI